MSTAPQPNLEAGAVIVPVAAGEPILRHADREISILLAREQISITHGRSSAGQQVAGRHIHVEHTDAFYVLEGELTFEIGCEPTTITLSRGGFIAAPPSVAHSFRTDGDRPARSLSIHSQDGGFAAFMRGRRDGIEVGWDISKAPAAGGLPASQAIVSPAVGDGYPDGTKPGCRLRCDLPDLRVAEWQLGGRHLDLPLHHHERELVSLFVIEGELEATLAGTTHRVGPDTLMSLEGSARHTIICRGSRRARMLTLHIPVARSPTTAPRI